MPGDSAAGEGTVGKAGYPCPIVSGGGTGTWDIAAECGVLNEIQAGSYVLMDAKYTTIDIPFENALFCCTTLVSRRDPEAGVLNAGLKSLTVEYGMPKSADGSFSVVTLADEHARITPKRDWKAKVGDPVLMIPAHIDPAINLHDVVALHRPGGKADYWIVDGRQRRKVPRRGSGAMTAAIRPGFFIAGERVESSTAEPWAVVDPARGTTIADWPQATEADVDRAVRASREAFETGPWRRAAPEERARALLEFARRIRAASEELAGLDSLNVGKPIGQARDDVEGAASFFETYAHLAVADPGEVIEYSERQMTVVVREPIEVVGAIIPWNFPITVAAAAAGAPLASGNSLVLKPSELTPMTAVRLAELAADLFPPGVFNVVTGTGQSVGRALARHPEVDTVLPPVRSPSARS